MDKMRFETPDGAAANAAKIAKLFPGAATEGKINFDLLRSMLGDEIFGDEAYEFTWVGKREAVAEAGKPIRKTLRPCKEESKEWDTTENLYIEGDNLEVLKLLQESYLGKVKMIYIDPPYNTGNDFIYRDKWTKGQEEYDEEAGLFDEETEERLVRNTESNGRFHSDWCSMIYPRLVLGRNLLREDGVIFISIDDNEVHNLRKICDEVFGEGNIVAEFIWQKQGNDNKSIFSNVKTVRNDHEYMVVYGKHIENIKFNRPEEKAEFKNDYGNVDNDPRGKWMSAELGRSDARSLPSGKNYYMLTAPNGTQWTRQWHYNESEMAKLILDNRVYFGSDGTSVPRLKKFLDTTITKIPSSLLTKYGSTKIGQAEVDELFDGKRFFDYPKPVALIEYLTKLATTSDDLVLDFFSGSSTTAHAVMQLNAEDGGRRRFIMVQLPEPCAPDSEAFKTGYADICEIGKERIRRAGDKIKEDKSLNTAELDVGFRVFKLDDTNMTDVYYAPGDYTQDMLSLMTSNIKPDRTALDLLYGCLLDWGLPLSMPHVCEELGGFAVHTVHGGDRVDLIACFDEAVSEAVIREIAVRRPLRAVFRDSSFISSPEKINVFEIFKLLAPDTAVRVI
ncbi:hypothetical protein R80B4_01603 [Fibrobacteres bacterium R8-0-B4]